MVGFTNCKGEMMTTARRPIVMSSLGLLSLAPVIAGCASADTSSAEDALDQSVPASEEAQAPAPSAEPTLAASYQDGSYQAAGGYQSPNGSETIQLSLTLENGVITAIEVTPGAAGGTSERYQGQFAGGIAAETIGKSLDELNVSRVAGSSLTSGGFKKALESIKADARG
jgi:uncharacterized protein with FMN-binding domain